VWQRRSGKRGLFVIVPMVLVLTVTVWSLVLQVLGAVRATGVAGFKLDTPTFNGGVSLLLIGLALVLAVEAVKALRAPRTA
jgi:predicted phage tail protein